MKPTVSSYLLTAVLVMVSLSLIGCASKHYYPCVKANWTEERWMQEVDTNPDSWVAGADSWFLTGDPSFVEVLNKQAPYSTAMSTVIVRVPDFTNIQVNGDFAVQIFGTVQRNSVYVYGPNDAVRDVVVRVSGNTLVLGQTGKIPFTKRAVVRIGINNLTALTQQGRSLIEAVRVQSNGLIITAAPSASGNIYLVGNVNLRRITNSGRGSINVFGANTAGVDISATRSGSVNVSGYNVNIRSLTHYGSANINIIGANCNRLTINAKGSGKIGLFGRVDLRQVQARGCVRIYAYPITSSNLHVYAYDKSRVGLAGSVHDLFVNTSQDSRFWGRYLCADNAYVRAYDSSHINISANNKIFATSTKNSSVYFFGSPNFLSPFVKGDGVVIPIWNNGASGCAMLRPRISYKGEDRPEERMVVRPVGPVKVKRASPAEVKAYSYPGYEWKSKQLIRLPKKPQGEG